VLAVWLRRQLYLRGIYHASEFSAWKGYKEARKIRISAEHTHFMLRRMYTDWEHKFGTYGHVEKKRRMYSKRIPIDSRPWDEKKRYTLPKIREAMKLCHQRLGRLPNSYEYASFREELISTFEDPRDFPHVSCIHKHFSSWRKVLEWAASELEIEGDPALLNNRDLAAAVIHFFASELNGRWPTQGEYDKMRRARRRSGYDVVRLPCTESICKWFTSWCDAQEHTINTTK
jgi:hypothetical protein